MAKKNSWKDLIIGHLIAFVFCIAFPGFVTAIAPVSWVSFQRNGDKVSARTHICMFFVVPYRSKTIDPVVGVGDRFVRGKVERSRSNSQSHRSEDEGFLVIHGNDQTVEVPVTPFNIKSVTKRAEDFLADPNASNLKMTVVANWKFSVFGGGLVSLLTVLYVFGILWSIWRGFLRLFGISKDDRSRHAPS
jgi:hypothetical protein